MDAKFSNPRARRSILQQVIDRWHVGRIESVRRVNGCHLVVTAHGRFAIFIYPTDEANGPGQGNYRSRLNYIEGVVGDFRRQGLKIQLLKRLSPHPQSHSVLPVVHQRDQYYRVYLLTKTAP